MCSSFLGRAYKAQVKSEMSKALSQDYCRLNMWLPKARGPHILQWALTRDSRKNHPCWCGRLVDERGSFLFHGVGARTAPLLRLLRLVKIVFNSLEVRPPAECPFPQELDPPIRWYDSDAVDAQQSLLYNDDLHSPFKGSPAHSLAEWPQSGCSQPDGPEERQNVGGGKEVNGVKNGDMRTVVRHSLRYGFTYTIFAHFPTRRAGVRVAWSQPRKS